METADGDREHCLGSIRWQEPQRSSASHNQPLCHIREYVYISSKLLPAYVVLGSWLQEGEAEGEDREGEGEERDGQIRRWSMLQPTTNVAASHDMFSNIAT